MVMDTSDLGSDQEAVGTMGKGRSSGLFIFAGLRSLHSRVRIEELGLCCLEDLGTESLVFIGRDLGDHTRF